MLDTLRRQSDGAAMRGRQSLAFLGSRLAAHLPALRAAPFDGFARLENAIPSEAEFFISENLLASKILQRQTRASQMAQRRAFQRRQTTCSLAGGVSGPTFHCWPVGLMDKEGVGPLGRRAQVRVLGESFDALVEYCLRGRSRSASRAAASASARIS